MDWYKAVLLALLINVSTGLSLKCGEDIVIQRGQKRVLRFWSAEDERLNVDVFSKNTHGSSGSGDNNRGQTLPFSNVATVSTGTIPSAPVVSGVTNTGSNLHSTSGSSNAVGGSSEKRNRPSDDGEDANERDSDNELYYSYNPVLSSQQTGSQSTGDIDLTSNKEQIDTSQQSDTFTGDKDEELSSQESDVENKTAIVTTSSVDKEEEESNKTQAEETDLKVPSNQDTTFVEQDSTIHQDLEDKDEPQISPIHRDDSSNKIKPYLRPVFNQQPQQESAIVFPSGGEESDNDEINRNQDENMFDLITTDFYGDLEDSTTLQPEREDDSAGQFTKQENKEERPLQDKTSTTEKSNTTTKTRTENYKPASTETTISYHDMHDATTTNYEKISTDEFLSPTVSFVGVFDKEPTTSVPSVRDEATTLGSNLFDSSSLFSRDSLDEHKGETHESTENFFNIQDDNEQTKYGNESTLTKNKESEHSAENATEEESVKESENGVDFEDSYSTTSKISTDDMYDELEHTTEVVNIDLQNRIKDEENIKIGEPLSSGSKLIKIPNIPEIDSSNNEESEQSYNNGIPEITTTVVDIDYITTTDSQYFVNENTDFSTQAPSSNTEETQKQQISSVKTKNEIESHLETTSGQENSHQNKQHLTKIEDTDFVNDPNRRVSPVPGVLIVKPIENFSALNPTKFTQEKDDSFEEIPIVFSSNFQFGESSTTTMSSTTIYNKMVEGEITEAITADTSTEIYIDSIKSSADEKHKGNDIGETTNLGSEQTTRNPSQEEDNTTIMPGINTVTIVSNHETSDIIKNNTFTNISSTTQKPNDTGTDIFADIIDRWTVALENLPEEVHVPVKDLVIDISEFLDIQPSYQQGVFDETYNRSSEDLPVEHRDPISSHSESGTMDTKTTPQIISTTSNIPLTTNLNQEQGISTESTSEFTSELTQDLDTKPIIKKVSGDPLHESGFQGMAGFIDTSMTSDLDDSPTTQESLSTNTEPCTEAQNVDLERQTNILEDMITELAEKTTEIPTNYQTDGYDDIIGSGIFDLVKKTTETPKKEQTDGYDDIVYMDTFDFVEKTTETPKNEHDDIDYMDTFDFVEKTTETPKNEQTDGYDDTVDFGRFDLSDYAFTENFLIGNDFMENQATTNYPSTEEDTEKMTLGLSEQTTEIIYTEVNTDSFTTLAPLEQTTLDSDSNFTKSDSSLPSDQVNVIKEKADNLIYNNSLNENQIDNAGESSSENKPSSATMLQESVNTQAITIPLAILKNPGVLNNLYNNQGKNDGSNVIINEQGSKVVINSPSNAVINFPTSPETITQTSTSTTNMPLTKEQEASTDAVTQLTSIPKQNINRKPVAEVGIDMQQTINYTSVQTSSSTTPSITKEPQQQEEKEVTEKANDIEVSSESITTVSSMPLVTKVTQRNSPTGFTSVVELRSDENATNSEKENVYNENEDILYNTATTYTPDITIEFSTESFWNSDDQFTLEYPKSDQNGLQSDNKITKPQEGSLNSVISKGEMSNNLSTSTSTVKTESLDNLSLETQIYDRTTTMKSFTSAVSDDIERATIIIPTSIVDHLISGSEEEYETSNKTTAQVQEDNTEGYYDFQETGILSRKDDDGQIDYGGDHPFFIRLPGSAGPVPVYLQYEPVEINYVPTNSEEDGINQRDDDENIDTLDINYLFRSDINSTGYQEADYDETIMENNTNNFTEVGTHNTTEESAPTTTEYPEMVDTTTKLVTEENRIENVTNIYRILDNVPAPVNIVNENQGTSKSDEGSNAFKPNKPILKQPDPFFVMEAPKLGNGDNTEEEDTYEPVDTNGYSNIKINENENAYSVDVSGQYGFSGNQNRNERPGVVEDVPLGVKKEVLYPGDYYLHDSYTGANLASLVNPVFSLRPKVVTPSPEEFKNPQYTPFPITANPPRTTTMNPPRRTTTNPTRTPTTTSPLASLPSFPTRKPTPSESIDLNENIINRDETISGSTNMTSSSTTEKSKTTTEKTLPSIEYSPIPAVDFDDSYSPSYNPEYLFANEESIVAPYANPFRIYPEDYEKAEITGESGLVNAAEKYSAEPYVEEEVAADAETPLKSSEEQAIPSDHFMAHKQAWAFPQSREDPGYLDYESYEPKNEDPGRVYSVFYSPREVPGIDPEVFSSRKVPPPASSSTGNLPQESSKAELLIDPKEQESKLVPTTETLKEVLRKEVEEQEAAKGELLASLNIPASAKEGNDSWPTSAQDVPFGPQFFQYLNSLPYALLRRFLDPTTPAEGERLKRSAPAEGEQIFCEWNIRTEPGLYLLMTFHNLSATYTVDCHGAYIEVERENNGYDARWCGSRVGQAGTRPHVIFAKTEVRITVYDDGQDNKSVPTGFEADIEVIDLFNARDYAAFMRSNAYPHIRRLLLG